MWTETTEKIAKYLKNKARMTANQYNEMEFGPMNRTHSASLQHTFATDTNAIDPRTCTRPSRVRECPQ